MKTTILKTLCAAFILAHVMSVSAQETPQTPQKEKKSVEEVAAVQTQQIATDLELTSEQTEKIEKINLNFIRKIRVAKESKVPEKELKTLYQNKRDSIKAVLNPEQIQTWMRKPELKKQQGELNKKN